MTCAAVVMTVVGLSSFDVACGQSSSSASADQPPMIPVGLDAYRMWNRWPYQRIGARAYMRSTYDRHGNNNTADASHFLYQLADDFNVSLDVEGAGVLYFARYNHWHGSPWHYEVDGTDHIVQETTTADPNKKLDHSVFIPERQFPNPLTWTYSITKGADLMWVPIGFERRFRMAYSRTFYGTGYYIYHHYMRGAKLSQPVKAWNAKTTPAADVLDLLRRSGTDIAPKPGTPEGENLRVREMTGVVDLAAEEPVTLTNLTDGPAMIRALKLSVPRKHAIAFSNARLRVTWDGRKHASIDAPVALFFGTGTLHNRQDKTFLVKALPVNVRFDEDWVHLACYFPMPLYRSAKIELIGPPERGIPNITWSMRYHPYTGARNHVAYFHATYCDHGVPEKGKDLVFLDTNTVESGGPWSGNFVGTSFIFSDRAVLNTLEGDPRFFFDDSQTPQAYGTGTEEWGGGGDYWGGRNMTLPLAGHPVGVRNAKEATSELDLIQSAYRYLLADLMPFGRRAVIRLEHGGINQSVEHYRSVTYWYGAPSASLVKTDELDIGNLTSEAAHQYVSPEASEPYELTSRYEWGPDRLGVAERDHPLARPKHYADFEFEADAGKAYYVWLRGVTDGGIKTDATWIQFDGHIGTKEVGPTYRAELGFGNWRDAVPAGVWSWASGLPKDPPLRITFDRPGRHRLRVQVRHSVHRLDQIRLSTTQTTRPKSAEPVKRRKPLPGSIDEIVLDVTDASGLHGDFRIISEPTASIGKVLEVGGTTGAFEVYPAHTQVGRITPGSSEFTLELRRDNLGVLLRRTLDYKYANQRAEVYVADTKDDEPEWQSAGVWYLAGSNTFYHSYPRKGGELGKSDPVVMSSNRRFRDDEFLIPRNLTQGRTAIRVRVKFTPVEIPLLPGRAIDKLVWSEMHYSAYCYVMPEIRLLANSDR